MSCNFSKLCLTILINLFFCFPLLSCPRASASKSLLRDRTWSTTNGTKKAFKANRRRRQGQEKNTVIKDEWNFVRIELSRARFRCQQTKSVSRSSKLPTTVAKISFKVNRRMPSRSRSEKRNRCRLASAKHCQVQGRRGFRRQQTKSCQIIQRSSSRSPRTVQGQQKDDDGDASATFSAHVTRETEGSHLGPDDTHTNVDRHAQHHDNDVNTPTFSRKPTKR